MAVAAIVRATPGSLRTLQITTLPKKNTEVRRADAVAAIVRATPGSLRTLQITTLPKKNTEVRRADAVAAIVRATPGSLRTLQITTLPKKNTEVRRASAVAAVVCATKTEQRSVDLIFLKRCDAKHEEVILVGTLIGDGCVDCIGDTAGMGFLDMLDDCVMRLVAVIRARRWLVENEP